MVAYERNGCLTSHVRPACQYFVEDVDITHLLATHTHNTHNLLPIIILIETLIL